MERISGCNRSNFDHFFYNCFVTDMIILLQLLWSSHHSPSVQQDDLCVLLLPDLVSINTVILCYRLFYLTKMCLYRIILFVLFQLWKSNYRCASLRSLRHNTNHCMMKLHQKTVRQGAMLEQLFKNHCFMVMQLVPVSVLYLNWCLFVSDNFFELMSTFVW